MRVQHRQWIVVGDRVLIEPEKGKERTRVGLYLPASAVDKMAVHGGKVVEVGPGTPVAAPRDLDQEPWKALEATDRAPQYVPLQARIGDYALFLKSAAVEIEHDGRQYLIVPQGALLLLVRDDGPTSRGVEVPDLPPDDL